MKQVQTGIAVSADGGVPVFHRAFDGGAGEVAQVVPMMKALQKLATGCSSKTNNHQKAWIKKH